MAQATRQVVQVRRKRHWRPIETDVIRFASGSVRNLCEVKLAPIGLPVAVTKMAYPRAINRRNDDPAALCALDRLVHIRILDVARPIISVDSLGAHQPCS